MSATNCNKFLAPNGEPSLLYGALLQKYGEDKALQIWTWVSTNPEKFAEKDVNEEPTIDSVDKIYAHETSKIELLSNNISTQQIEAVQEKEVNPLSVDETALKKSQEAYLVPIRDENGNATGKYFDTTTRQVPIVASITKRFMDEYELMQKSDEVKKDFQRSGLSPVEYIKKRVYDDYNSKLKTLNTALASDKLLDKSKVEEVLSYWQPMINSFSSAEGNGFWEYAIRSLELNGIKFTKDGNIKSDLLSDLNEDSEQDENTDVTESERQKEDWQINNDSIDMKTKASPKLKGLFLSVPDAEFRMTTPPKQVIKLPVNNQSLRQRLGKTVKTIHISFVDFNDKFNMQMGKPVTAYMENRPVIVTGERVVTPEYIEQYGSYVKKNEDGFELRVGDIVCNVKEFIPEKQPAAKQNFMGLAQSTDQKALWKKVQSLLVNTEPSAEVMLDKLMKSDIPEVEYLARKIKAGSGELAKELVRVMSAHSKPQMIVMYVKGNDGHLSLRVIEANRNSEVKSIVNQWKVNQTQSEILKYNSIGQAAINTDVVKKLSDELQGIYEKSSAEEKKEFFKKVLKANGIILDDKAIDTLLKDREFRSLAKQAGSDLRGIYGGMTQEGKPLGVVDAIISRLEGVSKINDKEESDFDDKAEEWFNQSPLHNEASIMKLLALAELPYSSIKFSSTHKNGNGDSVQSIGMNTAFSHAIRKLKEGNADYIAAVSGDNYRKRSWLFKHVQNSPVLLNQINISYADSLKNKYGSNSTVTNSSERELIALRLGLFLNAKAGRANYLSMTHSDKTVSPVMSNVPKLQNVFIWNGNQLEVSQNAVANFYNHVFLAEYERKIKSQGENIKGFEQGKNHFYAFPYINEGNLSQLVKNNIITQQEFDVIYNSDGSMKPSTTIDGGIKFQDVIAKVIKYSLEDIANKELARWQSSKLLEVGVPGSKGQLMSLLQPLGFAAEDKAIITPEGRKVYGDVAKNIMLKALAYDFAINDFMHQVNLSQLVFGDPAQFWKKSFDGTLTEYSKRLAGPVASGLDTDNSHGKLYIVSVVADDFNPVIHELKVAGLNWNSNATDAQQFGTMKEWLHRAYGQARITEKQYNEALNQINSSKDGNYKFDSAVEKLYQLEINPEKPVVYGMGPTTGGVTRTDYTKPSTFYLYPPMTQGLEIDKVRKAMEKDGVDVIDFISNRKVGAPVESNLVKLFNADGTVNEDVFNSDKWKTSARQNINRDNYRVQQEINPHDEDAEIAVPTQAHKNIREGLVFMPDSVKFNVGANKEMTGEEVRNYMEDLTKQWLNSNQQEYLDKMGATKNADGTIGIKDYKKLLSALAEYTKGQAGYQIDDFQSLIDFVEGTSELKIPFMLNKSFPKLEMKMFAELNTVKDLMIPGMAFVQVSSAGMQPSLDYWENAKYQSSDIIWTAEHSGSLKTAALSEDGTQVTPAQVLVSQDYFAPIGLDLNNFIIDVNGKKMIDTNKLSKEALQLVAVRIPNQGHGSMLPIEIAGFLSTNVKSSIIVPAAIAKQMGSDFDVDKLYTFRRGVTKQGKLIDDLKSKYFNTHWGVLTNPAMFSRMMQELDKPDLAEQKDLYAEKSKEVKHFFTAAVQDNIRLSLADAKIGVGQNANEAVANAELENRDLKLGKQVFEDGELVWKDASIEVLDNKGNPVQLQYVSGNAISTYIDKDGKEFQRTKGTNSQLKLGAAVDNAKDEHYSANNFNRYVATASNAMSRLQTEMDNNKVGWAMNLSYQTALFNSPILLEYVNRMKVGNDTLSNSFVSDLSNTVLSNLRNEYLNKITSDSKENIEKEIAKIKFNSEKLREAANYKSNSKEFLTHQIAALDLFQRFNSIGKQLTNAKSAMSQNTLGAGKDMLSALTVQRKVEKLGYTPDEITVRGLDKVFDVENGRTELGTFYDVTTKAALQVFSELIPVYKFESAFNNINSFTNPTGEPNQKLQKEIIDATQKFINSSSELDLFPSAYEERKRLMFGPDSLAKRLAKAQSTWAMTDPFLKELSPVIATDGKSPDTVTYVGYGMTDEDVINGQTAMINMISSADEERRKLASDLVRYLYATGGKQNAKNFMKFVGHGIITGSGIAEGQRKLFDKVDELFTASFYEQYLQHNPVRAKQLSQDLEEIGSPKVVSNEFTLTRKPIADSKSEKLGQYVPNGDGTVTFRYDNYISVRDGNKWRLFKQDTNSNPGQDIRFYEIDTLGSDQITEYDQSARGEVKSVFPKNQTAGSQSNNLSFSSAEGSGKEIMAKLYTISQDLEQPGYLREVAALLTNSRNEIEEQIYKNILGGNADLNFKIVPELKGNNIALFNSVSNTLSLTQQLNDNKLAMAENIVHEMLHYNTNLMLFAYESIVGDFKRDGIKAETLQAIDKAAEFIKTNPELLTKLESFHEIYKETKERWSKLGTGVNPHGLSNLREFMAGIFTNQNMMKWMNKQEYKGKKSLFEHIKDALSKIWGAIAKAFGIAENSLLEESVKRGLDVITHKRIQLYNYESNPSPDLKRIDQSNIFSSPNVKNMFTANEKAVAKLQEQLSELRLSLSGRLSSAQRLERLKQIEDLKRHIKELSKPLSDVDMLFAVGDQWVKYAEKIAAKSEPTENELATAIYIADMWKGMRELIYDNEFIQVDDKLKKLVERASQAKGELIAKGREYIAVDLDFNNSDFDKMVDIPVAEQYGRPFSVAKSIALSKIGGFIETVGRQEDEERDRVTKDFDKLIIDMNNGNPKGTAHKSIINSFINPTTGRMHTMFTDSFHAMVNEAEAKRNAWIYAAEKNGNTEMDKVKHQAWDRYKKAIEKQALFLDTNKLFDAQTGELKVSDEYRKHLDKEIGAEYVDLAINEAQKKYKGYIQAKQEMFDYLDGKLAPEGLSAEEANAKGLLTAEEIKTEKEAFQNKYSPNVILSNSDKRSFSPADDRFVHIVPKASSKEMWNEEYKKITEDEKTREYFDRFNAIRKTLISYMPANIQEKMHEGFMPVVHKEQVKMGFEKVLSELKNFRESMTKNFAASEYEMMLNKVNNHRIPTPFVDESDVDMAHRSKEIEKDMKLFIASALHYKHASAAKDSVELIKSILSDIHTSRLSGNEQMESNGKIITVKEGVEKAIKQFDYLVDALIYLKPRKLEYETGFKLRAENIFTVDKDGNKVLADKKFYNPLNPFGRHRKISKEVEGIQVEITKLKDDFKDGKLGETAEENQKVYDERLAGLNEKLSKYQEYTIHGSKAGDWLLEQQARKSLGLNVFSAFSNLSFGLISTYIHAAGGLDFNTSEVNKAWGMMMGALKDKELAKKVHAVMDRLGVIGDYVENKYGKHPELRAKAIQKYTDPFVLMRESDFFMKGVSTLAMLLHKQIDVTEEGETKKVSAWDTLKSDGSWDSDRFENNLDWYNPDSTIGVKKWNDLRNYVSRVNMILHGNMDKNSPMMAKAYVLGRLLGQFRMSWMIEGWYSRFGSEREDPFLGRTVKGRYKTLQSIGVSNSLKSLFKGVVNMLPFVNMDITKGINVKMANGDVRPLSASQVDVDNMKRNARELQFYLTLSAAVLLLKSLKGKKDDDDTPVLNASMNVLINMMIRSRQDINLYASPSVFDAVFRNPIPASDVVKDFKNLLKYSTTGWWNYDGGEFGIDDKFSMEKWFLKLTKGNLVLPEAALVNKLHYMATKDLDSFQ